MTNKIVILENSVELYEHYINDEKWEKALAFPRGGVTYLVSNGTIKFYATDDYLYRNVLISMQLPVYILDEKRSVEGEYDDLDELIKVLDPIFPANEINAELEYYLTKVEAANTYQPIGDYILRSEVPDLTNLVSDEDLVEALEDYYTKDEADDILDDKLDASAYTPCDLSNYYTKDESDARFQPIGDYVALGDYNAYTSTTTSDIENLKVDKLDVTAYTPTDLSNYYTKQEVYNKNETYNRNEIDDKIAEAGGFDPTRYYTKDVSDTRFALKNEIPSLSGYATEDWVINKNYATRADFITYINNIQTQINSLIEAVSGCCETQEDVYRWLTIIGEYLCEDNNKYEKQKYQVSHDGGIVWEDVTPIQYQKGQLLESDSTDCGYVPDPQYRWKAAPTSDYMCSGTSKYYKVYYEVSYDGGQTWQHAVPEQTKRGDLIEANSTDCGYIAPQYRWQTAPNSDYICSGTTKYQKQYYQVSYDGGTTWANVSPTQTRAGSVIEYNSTVCGYQPSDSTKYLTFIPSENGTFKFTGEGTIPNTASYSLDSGSTWVELESGENTPTITSGSKIMWKGSMSPASSSPMFGVGTFSSTCRFAVEGNPMSLIYNDNFANQKSLSGKNHTFDGLFKNCTKLTSIEHFVLPATTLANSCYQYMFEGCTSLTTVPSDLLTATTLTEGCYCGMFKGCTSLTSMVNLPATKMNSNCYNSMYSDCTSLTTAKKLPSTILDSECYHMMFKGCSNLTTVPSDMLPATTLKDRCYGEMFYGCSKMETAPVLPAKTLVYTCYNGMFENCSKLNYIKCLATSINTLNATTAWVKGVQTNSGTFVKDASMNSWNVCDTSYYKGIPCNWTVQNAN